MKTKNRYRYLRTTVQTKADADAIMSIGYMDLRALAFIAHLAQPGSGLAVDLARLTRRAVPVCLSKTMVKRSAVAIRHMDRLRVGTNNGRCQGEAAWDYLYSLSTVPQYERKVWRRAGIPPAGDDA